MWRLIKRLFGFREYELPPIQYSFQQPWLGQGVAKRGSGVVDKWW